MGNTYRKERSFDERRSNKPKRNIYAQVERKSNKNHRLIDVIYENDEDIDFEDENEFESIQHNKQK